MFGSRLVGRWARQVLAMAAIILIAGTFFSTVPASAASSIEYSFTFANGQTISGTSQDNVAFLNNAGGTDADNPTGMEIHVSCSDKFPGGFGEKDGPDPALDSAWQISSFQISKVKDDGKVEKTCGSDDLGNPNNPAGIEKGKAYSFTFVNGQTISGVSEDNVAFLPNAGGTDANNPIGMEIHVSCSDDFPGGFGEKDGPDSTRDSAWQLASYRIDKIDKGEIKDSCSGSFTPPGPPPTPSIQIIKTVNGQDANVAPGPEIAVGDEAVLAYEVINTGTVTLQNVAVVDADLGLIPCPSTTLQPGDSFFCDEQSETVTEPGAVFMEASVSGTATISGAPALPAFNQGKGNYFTFVFTNGVVSSGFSDGNTAFLPDAGGTDPDNPIGVEVHVSCSDDYPGGFGEKDGPTPGRDAAVASYTIAKVKDGKVDKTCSDVLTPVSQTVTDDDPINFVAVLSTPDAPSIDLMKTVNGQDANSAPGPTFQVGDTITIGYKITNNGDTPLSDISVTDLTNGAVTCNPGTLAPGASFTCPSVTEVVTTPGNVFMEAVVEGTSPAGVTVTDDDPINFVVNPGDDPADPSIELVKFINGWDANNAPGPTFDQGSTATFGYRVTNNGDTTLNNIVVTDDTLGVITCPVTTLAPGARTFCSTTKVLNTPGGVFMEADVQGTSPAGTTVTDDDPVNFTVKPGDDPGTGPGSCTVEVSSTGEVVVSWTSVPNAHSYQVLRNGHWRVRTDQLSWTDAHPRSGAVYEVEAVFANEAKSTRTTCS